MLNLKAHLVRAVALAFTLLLPTFIQAAENGPQTFSIGPQPLSTALSEFARQSQQEILFSPDIVAEKTSNGVQGTLQPLEALSTLLKNTGIGFSTTPNGAILLRNKDSIAATGNIHLAQATQTPESPKSSEVSSETSETDGSVKLQEIVVTATKRTERLQDVPMSITAMTSDTIEKRGFVDAEDYLRRIPGVSQMGEDGKQVVIIRGLETGVLNRNFDSGPTTATYFGETPITTSSSVGGNSGNDVKLIDIERVEVLRGPQGTSFGNAALGGAVRVIPAEPKLGTFDAKVSAEYSSTAKFGGDNYDVDAVLNVPLLADKLAIRAVGYKVEHSGYYRNVTASNAAYRATVIDRWGAEPFAVDQGRVGDRDVWGARLSLLAAPTDALRISVNYIDQETEIDGRPGTNTGVNYEQVSVLLPIGGRIRDKPYAVQDSQTQILNGKAEYDFGWSDLVATYSHVKSGAQSNSDFYRFPAPFATRGRHDGEMAEVRLATKLDGAINALVGIYYEDLKDRSTDDFFWVGDPAIARFRPFLDQAEFLLGIREDNRSLEQKAGFGEFTWKLTEHVSLTGGARFYNYERRFREFARGPAFYGPGIDNDESQDVSGESFKLNASYKPNENTHLYAGWAEGFRLGRPNPALPSSCDVDSDGMLDGIGVSRTDSDVKSDTVDSYEAGGKFRFLDRRLQLDAAVFRIDWADIPLGVTVPTCFLSTYVNVAKARSEGLEAQLSFQLTDALHVDASGSWTDARVLEDFAPAGVREDDRLPGSPQYNASLGLEYGFRVLTHEAFVRADSTYVGEFYTVTTENPANRSGDYTIFDLTAGMDFDRLRVTIFAKNLTDDDAYTLRFPGYGPVSQQLQPRTTGVRIGYTF